MGKPTKKSASKVDSAPSAKTLNKGSQTLFIGNLNWSIEEDDVRNFFKDVGEVDEVGFVMKDDNFLGYGHVEFLTAEAAQKALKLNNELLLDRPVKLHLIEEKSPPIAVDSAPAVAPTESTKTVNQGSKTLAKEKGITFEATGSKTLLIGNLNLSIEEDDVRNFFKDVGEVDEVGFVMKDDIFLGYGHVEFLTAEAAQKALKLNNELLLDRPVKLHPSPPNPVDSASAVAPTASTKTVNQGSKTLAKEKGIAFEATGSKTLFIGNLNLSIEEDDVREFFKDVGEVDEIGFVMKDDNFLGHGLVEFLTAEAAQKALKLNNELLLDHRVELHLIENDSAHAGVAPSPKTMNKGKRDAAEIDEQQVVGSKKQKITNGDEEQAIAKKTKTQKKHNPTEETNSSSKSEEEQEKPSVTQDAVKPNLELKKEEDGDLKKSSDDEPSKSQSMKNSAQDAKRSTRTGDESEENNRDDRSVEDVYDQLLKSPKKNDTDVEKVDSPSEKKMPQTLITSQATGSKTVFMGNLNSLLEEDDVREFFKDVGEVDEVGFAMKDDSFLGYAHVEFFTAEVAQKALKLNNELLLDRPVKLHLIEIDSAHADVAPSPKTINKGKRDAEEIVEQQAVGSKKQKIANGGEEQAVEKKPKTLKKHNKTEKTYSSSKSEEEQEKSSATQDAVKPNLELKRVEDSDLKKSSDDEPSKSQSMKNSMQNEKIATRTGDESEEINGDDRSVEDDYDQLSKSLKKNLQDTDVEKFDSPSEMKMFQTIITPQATGSKTVFMGNLNFSIEEGDVRDFFKDAGEIAEIRFSMRDDRFMGYAHVEFTTTEAAEEALKLNRGLLLDRRVKLDLVRQKGSYNPVTNVTESKALAMEGGSSTPITSQAPGSKNLPKERASFTPMTPQAPGSTTLFIANLSYSIKEDDVRSFFKDVGEVAEVRFFMREDRFTGYGHVVFTTTEAAQKAIKLNNELLLDRPVRLDFAKERNANTQLGKENQKGGQAHGQTVYIRGFDPTDSIDNIRSTLEEHFGKCGEISRISIPRDYDGPKGVAFIDFMDSNGFHKALELNGSEAEGRVITVEEAKRPRVDSREGSGYGGRSGGRGRFSGGRDGGRGRGGRSSWTESQHRR